MFVVFWINANFFENKRKEGEQKER